MKQVNLLILFIGITTKVFAQSAETPFEPSGKPIVQVFGTALYDIENKHYAYSFGRAHLGYQYQFSPKWSMKIIIDRGRATSVDDIIVNGTDGNILTVENTSKEGAYYTMFLKFASLQWRVDDKLTLEGGAILQNHYITQERFWGFRLMQQLRTGKVPE